MLTTTSLHSNEIKPATKIIPLYFERALIRVGSRKDTESGFVFVEDNPASEDIDNGMLVEQ